MEKMHCKKCRNNRTHDEFKANGRKYKTCNICRVSRKKITIQTCKDFANTKNGECLSTEYKNAHIKILWECNMKHKWEANFNSIRDQHSWCPVCAGKLLTINECKEYAVSKNGLCVSPEYKNTDSKMLWRCKDNHEWEARFGDIKRGRWCPTCVRYNMRLTLEECQEFALSKEGECLSNTYIGAHTKMKWKCKENHEWEAEFHSIKKGRWCPQCSASRSEKSCREIFEEHYEVKFPTKKPKWLKGLELDGYNEELGIAFEYNGKQHYEYVPHFHRNGIEEFHKQQARDRTKYEICAKKNIKLILIPYKFDFRKPDLLKEFILDAISTLPS